MPAGPLGAGFAAIVAGDDAAAMTLALQNGASLVERNAEGHTLLTFAAREGRTAIVAALLDHGADIDQRAPEGTGDTALCYAVWFQRPAVARLLVERGADPNLLGPNGSPLIFAVQRKSVDLVNAVLEAKDLKIDLRDKWGDTALGHALGRNFQPELASLLIEHEADINYRDSTGYTPLMWACWRDVPEKIQFILDHDADPNVENEEGETAYTKAAQRGDVDLMEALVGRGAKRHPVRLNRPEWSDPELTSAQKWALAVPALRMQVRGCSLEILGGWKANKQSKKSEQLSLLTYWEISDRDELLATFVGLEQGDRRYDDEAEGRKYFRMSDAAFIEKTMAMKPAGAQEAKILREAYGKYGEDFGAAWDYCRYITLADWGYLAGYLNEEEAWMRIMAAARTLQGVYRSWEDLGDCYLLGRTLWAGDDEEGMKELRAVFRLLKNVNDPLNPWVKNAWETELGEGATLPL